MKMLFLKKDTMMKFYIGVTTISYWIYKDKAKHKTTICNQSMNKYKIYNKGSIRNRIQNTRNHNQIQLAKNI